MNAPILNPPPPPPLVPHSQFVARNLEPILGSQDVRKEFLSLCQEFIDNKLPINFGEDKTNPKFFSEAKSVKKIDLFFVRHCIKQLDTIECLYSQLVYKLSEKRMATKALKKVIPV